MSMSRDSSYNYINSGSTKNNYSLDVFTIRRLCHIIKTLSEKQHSLIFLIFLVSLALLEQYIVYYVGIIPSGFYEILGNKNWNGFWEHTLKAFVLILSISLVIGSKLYVSNMLYASWRQILTQELQKAYFYCNKFFVINTIDTSRDNPDQRITQDVDKFCNQLSKIVSPLLVSPFTISYYTYLCYSTSGWIGPVGIFGVFVISAIINKLLIKPIVNMVILQEKCEGYFRFKHMHVRTNAESVAFQDAGSTELSRASDHLNRLINAQQTLFVRQFPLDVAVNLFNYIGSIVSYLILAAPLFSGAYSHLSTTELGALISKNAFISIYLISCFSSLVDLSTSISQLGGLTHRISELLEYLEEEVATQDLFDRNMPSSLKHENDSYIIQKQLSEDAAIELKNVTFSTPCSNTPLVFDLSLKFVIGSNLLITGNSSSGKTSLLRVIKGLWPVLNGSIERRLAFKPSSVFFLPQKPLLTDGSLREQIIYPLESPKYLPPKEEENEIIQSYLEYAGLNHILDKAGLDEQVEWNWYDILSPGEAQRLSFVRLFYHRPVLAFLDEATSAIGHEMETKLYEKCKSLNITLVSTGHRSSLTQFHDFVLHVDGQGGWTLSPMSKIN